MNEAYVIAARRTPVAPRNTAFRSLEVAELAAPVFHALLRDARLDPSDVDDVVLGNALYAGGNPARVCALAAGLPEATPAMTIDTQCCAGLDALMIAAGRIRAGEAQAIIAGGVESYSRSPLRARRPLGGESATPYERPQFSPWSDRDPDLIEAASVLARARRVTRDAQECFAVDSHSKSSRETFADEIAPLAGLERDAFTRSLTIELCKRMPVIAGDATYGLTAATIAVEADAAAMLLVVSHKMRQRLGSPAALRVLSTRRVGLDPAQPASGAQAAAGPLLTALSAPVAVAEIMESFASQAMAAIEDLGLDPGVVNRGGGALSRGHPIGASGAILAVRLFREMAREQRGALGLAAIAAAGGLGSAVLLERD